MGAVNYCLKALIKRGWVKVGNLSASQNKLAYSCLLTPSGIAEKGRLTSRVPARDEVMSLRNLGRRSGHWATRLSACRYAERFCYLDKQLVLSKLVGTQALQVIENITYLLDCHAGGRGFESRPLRHPLLIKQEVRIGTDVCIAQRHIQTRNDEIHRFLGTNRARRRS